MTLSEFEQGVERHIDNYALAALSERDRESSPESLPNGSPWAVAEMAPRSLSTDPLFAAVSALTDQACERIAGMVEAVREPGMQVVE